MSSLRRVLGLLLAVSLMAGCSTIKVSDRDEYEGPALPRPARILVYDLAATPADLPEWSVASSHYAQAAATVNPDELAAGRKLGADVAKELKPKFEEQGWL